MGSSRNAICREQHRELTVSENKEVQDAREYAREK